MICFLFILFVCVFLQTNAVLPRNTDLSLVQSSGADGQSEQGLIHKYQSNKIWG